MHSTIKQQLDSLLAVPAFSKLDDSWARSEGPSFFEQLEYPDWMEGPLVYPKRGALGNYWRTLQAAIDVVPGIHPEQKRVLTLAKWQYWQPDLSRKGRTEALENSQLGDFVIVPAQRTDRYPYAARHFYQTRHNSQFGIDSEIAFSALTEASFRITHPNARRTEVVCCAGDWIIDTDTNTKTSFFIDTSDAVEFTVGNADVIHPAQITPSVFTTKY